MCDESNKAKPTNVISFRSNTQSSANQEYDDLLLDIRLMSNKIERSAFALANELDAKRVASLLDLANFLIQYYEKHAFHPK